MPFTPRWLIHHGREEEARKTLATLRSMPIDHELIEIEFLEIKAQSMFEKRTVEANFPHLVEPTAWNIAKLQFVAIASLFKTMPMFRRVIVATVTMFFQVSRNKALRGALTDKNSNGLVSMPFCITRHRFVSRLHIRTS